MCLVLPSAAGEPWGPGSGASLLIFFHLPHREAVTLVVNRPFQAELGTGVPKQGDSRHHTLEPLLKVLSLAGEEGTTLSFPGHASTDFQRRSRTELSLARRHFWDAGSSLLPPSRGPLSTFSFGALCLLLVLPTGLPRQLVARCPGCGC